MSIESIGRSTQVTVDTNQSSTSLASHAAVSAPDAVHTDLPAPQAVVAAPKSEPLPVDNAQQAQARAELVQKAEPDFLKNKIVLDGKNQEIVFLTVDDRTGEVINKFPSTAVLATEAYQQAVSSTSIEPNIQRVA